MSSCPILLIDVIVILNLFLIGDLAPRHPIKNNMELKKCSGEKSGMQSNERVVVPRKNLSDVFSIIIFRSSQNPIGTETVVMSR